MIVVVIMYSEIIILDEISNELLAIRFQSRFANSSGFPNSRILKVGRISLRICDPCLRLTMLEPLFTPPYGQKIAKRCAQNFESGYI